MFHASNLNGVNEVEELLIDSELHTILTYSMQASEQPILQAALAAHPIQVVDSSVLQHQLPQGLVLEEQVRQECAESLRSIFAAFPTGGYFRNA